MGGPHSPNHALSAVTDPCPTPNPSRSNFRTEPASPAIHPSRRRRPRAYPKRRSKRRLIIGLLVAVALVAAMTVAIVYGVRTNGANTGAASPRRRPKPRFRAIWTLSSTATPTRIVRNALCGMYDGVRDKRSDQALAKLSSDAFRKQFSEVEVTSIDKIVYLSQYQAQALFTMQVSPATGGPMHGQVQGVAQLLFQRGQILVCSYVLRTGSSYWRPASRIS